MSGGSYRYAYTTYLVLVSFYIVVAIAAIVGWCMNVYKIFANDSESMRWFIGRIVGAFIAPIGAVLGYF